MNATGQLWFTAIAHLRRSWQPVLITHLTLTALGVALFAPLLGLTGRLLIGLSDQPALADQDIAYFFLSPVGLAALILFSALLIGVLAFEQAALMRIAVSAAQGHTAGVMEALQFLSARIGRLLLFATALVVRVLGIVLPFLAVSAVIARFLLTEYDINYYLSETPPALWTAVVLIGLVVIAMLVVLIRKLLGWSLALPLTLFGDVSPLNAFRESVDLVQGNRRLVLGLFVVWAVIAMALSLLTAVMVRFLGSWVLPTAGTSVSHVMIVIGGLLLLWAAANLLIGAFASGSFACLVIELYSRLASAWDQAVANFAKQKVQTRFHPAVVALATLGAVAVAVFVGIRLINQIQITDDVLIVAHRGAAGKAPENTLASVRQAIEDQADWIEIDVQESADGEVVVIHDSDFMKLAGNPLKVWESTSQQLREIDVGSWFDPGFATERVPTLREVLEIIRGAANLVIELKYYGHDQMLEQRVADIVEDMGMVDETAIMSLKYDAVTKMRTLRPDWTVGLLSATAIGDLSKLDADFLAVAMGMVSGGFIRRAHDAGKQVFAWTINDPVSMSHMMSLGVDGIITDEPEMARRVMAERAKLSSAERLLVQAALLFGVSFNSREYRDDSP